MNTDQLTYLIEVSKNNSLASASKTLHITPQALSIAIKKLEKELGFALLNRSYKGISLTTDGEWLVREASVFLNKVAQRQKQYLLAAEDNHQHVGELHIHFNYSGINNGIFGQVICDLSQTDPDLNIQLKETAKESILEKLESRDINFGIIFRTTLNDNYSDELDDTLVFEPLFDGKLVVMTSPHSELAKFQTISLKKLSQYPLCNYSNYDESLNSMEKFFTDMLKIPITYIFENNFSIYKEKVLRGLANACTIHFSIDDHPSNYLEEAHVLNLRENIKSYFGLVYRKDVELTDNEKYFIQVLKNHVANIQKASDDSNL